MQVKASYKLSEDFKKGPAKPKKAKKPAAAKPKKVCTLAQAVSPAGDLHLYHRTGCELLRLAPAGHSHCGSASLVT